MHSGERKQNISSRRLVSFIRKMKPSLPGNYMSLYLKGNAESNTCTTGKHSTHFPTGNRLIAFQFLLTTFNSESQKHTSILLADLVAST